MGKVSEQEKKEIENIIKLFNEKATTWYLPKCICANLSDAIAAYIDKRDEERLREIKQAWNRLKYLNELMQKDLLSEESDQLWQSISKLAKEMGWEREAKND